MFYVSIVKIRENIETDAARNENKPEICPVNCAKIGNNIIFMNKR